MAPRYLTEEYLQDVNQLYNNGDWEKLLELHGTNGEEDRVLLWPRPHLNDLRYIVDSVKVMNKQSLVSIGCGTGLLEWFIHQSTGFPVYGVEVDRKYWAQKRKQSKLFINAVFPDDKEFIELTTSQNNALLFCYFNNRSAFTSYLEQYKGNCLIIIGPQSTGRHTDPGPFDLIFETYGWKLLTSKEIRDSKDYIVIYTK